MADTALKLVLLGEDRTASKALKGVGSQAGQTQGKLSKLGGTAGLALKAGLVGALVAAGDAAVQFGSDSLAAFADADKSQKQLEDAYKRFPKVQSLSIESLRKYNTELQRKTGADADDVASGQAVLARYKLTGQQLKTMTPLLVDYAARTGKSIPDAAKTMGKALGGSSKLAKEMGFAFADAKDPAKNFDQVVAGLKDTVGGYADKVPEAEKKQKILQASFGDLQEAVGEKLQPVMLGLIDAGQGVMDWLTANPEATAGASAAWDLFSSALGGLWDIIRKWILPGLGLLMDGQTAIIRGTASMLDALGTIPGFEWAKGAAANVRKVADASDAVADGLKSLANDPPPKIDIDDGKAQAKAAKIDKKIADLNKRRIKLKSEGDTKGADKIEKKIRDLKKQKHEIKVGVGLKRTGPQKATISRMGGSGGTMRISLNASGAQSFAGGLTWVGDGMGHSPELVALPTGSRILSNGQSRAAASQAATSPSGGGNVYVTVSGDTSPASAARRIARTLTVLPATYGRGWRPTKGR